MKKSEAFPSKYFRADDLPEPATLTILSADLETLKNHKGEAQEKIVLSFKKTKKKLPLNLTNFDSVCDITGKLDSDDFPGHQIQVYASEVQVGAEMKSCVRVRDPDQAELKPKATATKRPVRPARGEPADMDDEIPWK